MNKTTVTIALLQNAAEHSAEANLEKTISCIRKAASSGANIICTQELFTSYYFCQEENHHWFSLAEPAYDGPTARMLSPLARELNVVIVASIFEERMPGIYHNTALVFNTTGELLGLYRKMHIPDDPAYYEKFYFTPGDLGFRVWDTSFARIGVLICWDQWFPEAARLTALQGAQILFYPSAIGWHPAEKLQFGEAQFQAWLTIQRAHAIANGCYVAAVNRVGHEILPTLPNSPGIEFWGQSFVADPFGKVLAKASPNEEQILLTEIDLSVVHTVRTHWPFFRDRRVEAYDQITKRCLIP